MERRKRRSFTPEFRAEAVRLVREGTKSLPQVAEEHLLLRVPSEEGARGGAIQPARPRGPRHGAASEATRPGVGALAGRLGGLPGQSRTWRASGSRQERRQPLPVGTRPMHDGLPTKIAGFSGWKRWQSNPQALSQR